MKAHHAPTSRLKRDLGSLEAYAAMIGMLVGAGIFRVTSVASEATGPGVILGYLLLAPAVLASSIPYAGFLSTSLGQQPGAEYAHLSHVLGGKRLAFLAAWLKLISYLGALAFLARALADYALALIPDGLLEVAPEQLRLPLALATLLFFFLIHARGVRWFGRVQVAMCAILGAAVLVLVVPGLFAIERSNYTPFLTDGTAGLMAALPPLFFAYAGFESIVHTAGEVRDSTKRLPRILLLGIVATTTIFIAMATVAFGVLPLEQLSASDAPMADAAAAYLPAGAAIFVTIGGILAVATSVNATMLVPARLGIVLANDGLLPRWLSGVHPQRGTPVPGLMATFVIAAALLLSGQLALALNVAVFALVVVYGLNSLAMLLLPTRNPELYAEISLPVPRRVQRAAAWFSLSAMVGLVVVQCLADFDHIRATTLAQRFSEQTVTSIELLALWVCLGLLLFGGMRRRRQSVTA